MYDRLISLIGINNYELIKNKNILLIGIGGVGSYALEALVRNGFINITIIDNDIIDITNLNRQLYTNQKNIGKIKVEEAKKRCLSINKNINITSLNLYLDNSNIDKILNNKYDYVIDACDSIDTKLLLMINKNTYNYKLISSMGTAKKMDPTKLSITTLDKTINDPLARILRKRIKETNIKDNIYVVSSTEIPIKIDKLGSNNIVPSYAGILCVYYIIDDIIKQK